MRIGLKSWEVISDLAANFTEATEVPDAKGKVGLITDGQWLKLGYRYLVAIMQ